MESTERSEEMTKAELMAEIENHEAEADAARVQRDAAAATIVSHEIEIDRLWTELYALGVTRARPRPAKGEAAVAKKRGAKAGAENA